MTGFETKGTICVFDKNKLLYALCEIDYLINKDETFRYRFKPNYSVIELLKSDVFQGIPGLNLDSKKDEYIRENIVPTFISERVPSKNRENYYMMLEEHGLDYMDPIMYLINDSGRYSGDTLFVIRYEEKKDVSYDDFNNNKTNNALIRDILSNICLGNDVIIGGQRIDDTNRKAFYDVLLAIYLRSVELKKIAQEEGINKAKEKGVYKGRKAISVDMLKYMELLDQVKRKMITPREAADKLGISIDKYYRIRKELQNENHTLLQ